MLNVSSRDSVHKLRCNMTDRNVVFLFYAFCVPFPSFPCQNEKTSLKNGNKKKKRQNMSSLSKIKRICLNLPCTSIDGTLKTTRGGRKAKWEKNNG